MKNWNIKETSGDIPVIGEPPVLLGSVQVKATESCRTSTMLGGGGASGTSKQYKNMQKH